MIALQSEGLRPDLRLKQLERVKQRQNEAFIFEYCFCLQFDGEAHRKRIGDRMESTSGIGILRQ